MKNKSGSELFALIIVIILFVAGVVALDGWIWMLAWGSIHSIITVGNKPWPSYTISYFDGVSLGAIFIVVLSALKAVFNPKS